MDQLHVDVCRLRMFGDIGQGFLKNPEEGGGLVGVQFDFPLVRREFAGNAALFFKLPCLPVYGCHQAEIQYAGAQVAGDSVDGFDRAVDKLFDIIGFFDQRRIGRQAARQ